ncbi:MAG: AtpZ/AtpI family protein [Pirellulaceae bacterium]|nr:AtpZ/AtpI family protein [Pirellulaceae bacterium]
MTDQHQDERRAINASVNAFSRVIAVMVLMVLPGIAGYFLDGWLGTRFLIVVGFILGMILAIFGLINIAKKANDELRKKR